jgi:hypothetical protein
MSNLTNTSTLKSQILQDVQCFIETSIDKLNSELALYGTENIYVPSTTNINLNPIPEFISNQSQSFDIQCAIPIVMEFSSPILTQDVGVNDYYQIFNKQIAQKAIDDINVYIRKLNTKIRGKSSGPSIFFTPKYYDINSTPTTTTTDIETRILSILNQIKTDL